SAKVTRSPPGSYRRAFDRPNEPRTFCTFPARRINQKRSSTNRIVGPKPRSRFCHHGAPVSSGSAFTVTPFDCSRLESASVFAKAGISVLKSRVGFEPRYVSFFANVPWIAVPFDVIDVTLYVRT